jgi:VWFA-related protein
VDTLGLTGNSARTADPLSFAFLPPGPSSPSAPTVGTGKHDAEILDNLRDVQRLQKAANDDQQRGRVAKLVNNLGGIGRVLDAARGRKHVLYFSEGFETRLLSGHMAGGDESGSLSQPIASAAVDSSTPQGMADAAASGEYWKVESDARFGSTATRSRMLDALTQFNRSDAVLNAIDISGLRAEGDASGSAAGSGTDALFAMAAATDGDLVRNANALAPELSKLEERTALVYLLVYQPKQLSKPGAFHALKVKVRAPGARVLARSGYYEPRPYQALSPLEKVLAAGDLVTGGSRENELAANLLAVPFASQAESPQVPVLLEIPGKELLAGETGASTAVQIYAYAHDAAGTLTDYLYSEMALDLAKVRTSLEGGGLKFYGTLYLPPGAYAVRALVRNAGSGRSAVAAAKVVVPKMPGGEPTLLPPFFEEAPGRWLMVRGNPRPDAPPRPADYPFAIAGDSFIPSVLPVVAPDGAADVAVVAYNFGAAASPAPLDVRAEIVGPDGTSRPASVTVARRSDVERGGGRKLSFKFQAAGLAPGRYALKVAVADPASKKTAESSSAFEVR